MRMMTTIIVVIMEARCSFRRMASALWAWTISFPLPAGTMRILGSLASSGLW